MLQNLFSDCNFCDWYKSSCISRHIHGSMVLTGTSCMRMKLHISLLSVETWTRKILKSLRQVHRSYALNYVVSTIELIILPLDYIFKMLKYVKSNNCILRHIYMLSLTTWSCTLSMFMIPLSNLSDIVMFTYFITNLTNYSFIFFFWHIMFYLHNSQRQKCLSSYLHPSCKIWVYS